MDGVDGDAIFNGKKSSHHWRAMNLGIGRISQPHVEEPSKWDSLVSPRVTHSVFKCSLRRMQPLN